MFKRDQFNSHLDDIFNSRYIIFGYIDNNQSINEIYSHIDTLIESGYNVAMVTDELIENVIIKDNYDHYAKVVQHSLQGGVEGINVNERLIGWNDHAIRYCMKHNIDLYGMEIDVTRISVMPEYIEAFKKDRELSDFYYIPIRANINKYREECYYRNIVKVKGYDKIVGIVGDPYLRTIKSVLSGEPSYLFKNFMFNNDVCIIRQPTD